MLVIKRCIIIHIISRKDNFLKRNLCEEPISTFIRNDSNIATIPALNSHSMNCKEMEAKGILNCLLFILVLRNDLIQRLFKVSVINLSAIITWQHNKNKIKYILNLKFRLRSLNMSDGVHRFDETYLKITSILPT